MLSSRHMLGLVLWLALGTTPLESRATVFTEYIAPLEIDADFSRIVTMPDPTFHRVDFQYLASIYRLTVSEHRNPDSGDIWITALERNHPDLGMVTLGTGTIVYDGASDCLNFNGAPLACGVLVPENSPEIRVFTIFTLFDIQCVPLRDTLERPFSYQMSAEFRFGGGVSPADLGTVAIEPTEFPAGKPQVQLSRQSIHPHVPSAGLPEVPAETTRIDVVVMDAIQRPGGGNCGVPLSNVEVSVKNTIEPESGSHRHFFVGGADPGTGKHALRSGELVEQPSDTELKALTGPFGGIETDYTPKDYGQNPKDPAAPFSKGSYGLSEVVEVSVKDPLTGSVIEADDQVLQIRVLGLVPLDTSGQFYILAGTFATDCDRQHNDSANVRRSHYVTPDMRSFAQELAQRFFAATADSSGQNGIKLSYNDASLEFGGLFDDGNNSNRDAVCHTSHRAGIDIDVNVGGGSCDPQAGYNLDCPSSPGYPAGGTRRKVLTEIAKELGAKKIEEPSLHYRLIVPPFQ